MAVLDSRNYSIPGLPVLVDVSATLLSLDFTVNIWFSLAKYVVKNLGQVIQGIIVSFRQLGDYVLIESEKSKARVRSASLIEVAKIYEGYKRSVSFDSSLPINTQNRIIERLDLMMEQHWNEIVFKY